ncbi:MAG: GNAT family N-acetyltransferase [Lachnospiraceae bacterium]|nr:GNAT family N-acetyltransferase [Lachnospiraceae bacterium]
MKYELRFYKKEYYNAMIELARKSYEWEVPAVPVSRVEFANTVNKYFNDSHSAWEKTVGCYFEDDNMVACTWNEACYDGENMLMFDSKERAQDEELLLEMIKHVKTYGAGIREDGKTREVTLLVPQWNHVLQKLLEKKDFGIIEWKENINVLKFEEEPFEVKLPEGYTFADGTQIPAVYLAMVHRHSFGYGAGTAAEYADVAFEKMRQEKHYNPKLELCVLDTEKRPVAFANIWYDEAMEYCELEPLAVCWWERRKGIATALMHELSNRVKEMYPSCKGMEGGDQTFYTSIGYEKIAEIDKYHWEAEIIISWEQESADKKYSELI